MSYFEACKDCPRREIGCHSRCREYLKEYIKNEMRKKKIHEAERTAKYTAATERRHKKYLMDLKRR